jgi:3-hydroxyisobutyrate dehydrogenase
MERNNAMKKIGWIGTGVMGARMCARLLAAGYEMHIHERDRVRAESLLARGAHWQDSPAAVAQVSEVTFAIVGFPADVEETFLSDRGVLAGAREGSIIVDMTSSTPALAESIHRAAAAQGVRALDAPVSGGPAGAEEGRLAIMAGGDEKTYNEVLPLFEKLGATIALMGPPGAGQHTKMCNQTLIALNLIGVVEALLYARKAGLDPSQVIDVVGRGAASSWQLVNMGPRMVAGDFAPGFYIKHFLKDMGIALAEARRMGLSLPGLSLVNQFYLAARAKGLEDLGTQGLYKVLESFNGLPEVPPARS